MKARRGKAAVAEPPIALSEAAGIRYMHFGSEWIQGAMRIRHPDAPVLEYVRRMCAWLLLMEPPARVLQLGLGAGALTRWALARLPGSRLVVVERSAAVIAAAHAHFALPREHPRLEVVQDDAGAYVARPSSRGGFGLLQVDLYDQDARGPVLDTPAFYASCRRALAEPGVVVINLFGEHASFAPNRERIAEAFGGRVLELPPIAEGNVVLLALAGPPLDVPVAAVLARGRELRLTHGLAFDAWARMLVDRYARGGRLRC